jgi:hypothetical protein
MEGETHMKRIKYVGPHDAVDVPVAGLEGVKRGAVVEVRDEVAESLLEQVDNWHPVKPVKRPAPRKHAVPKPADENAEG